MSQERTAAKRAAAASLAAWEGSGEHVSLLGHAVFCRRSEPGAEEALLLVHGFPTASWDWQRVWDPLAARWHLHTLDMLGFGFSAKPPDHLYSIASQADLFEAYLERAGVRRYHILAHDYGDTVAQELLARQAERGNRPRIASVAFLNGGLFPESHRPLLTQRLLASPLGPLVARFSTVRSLRASMARIFGPATPPDANHIEAFWMLITRNEGRRVLPKLIRYMDERRRHRERWVGAITHATVPIALINGAADPISGRHMAERFRALVPGASVTVLDKVGHYPQIEAPEDVLEAYFHFRDRNANREQTATSPA